MKKVVMILVSCFGLALMIATPAHAQMPGTPIRVTIPFDFNVKGKTLSAGKYEIRRISDSPEGLQISNLANHEQSMFETESVEAKGTALKGELVFHRYGDTYFLYEIFTPGMSTGRELPRSHAERRFEREAANTKMKPEMVALAID